MIQSQNPLTVFEKSLFELKRKIFFYFILIPIKIARQGFHSLTDPDNSTREGIIFKLS